MKALLGTEIIRFRQKEPKNETMKNLFYWLEKLNIEKVIYPDATEELGLVHEFEVLTVVPPHKAFIDSLPVAGASADEQAADAMLFAVHNKTIQAFITEDGRTLANADALGLSERVVNTNHFISRALYKNPELIKYKSLAVKPMTFKDCNVDDQFFDSFKQDYDGFAEWFKKKADKEVYVCKGDDSAYLGFLFLKFEDEKEDYSDIIRQTYNDRHKVLFNAMLSVLNSRTDDKLNAFYFGTTHFEHVWERTIDEAYGEDNKKDYFPPFRWYPNPEGLFNKGSELRPDTIMKQRGDYFVLDAKYYAFCVDKKYMPSGSDINKQIVYGKYAADKAIEKGEKCDVFTAFLIPYNFTENPYNISTEHFPYCNIGYATGWQNLSSEGKYARVIAILVDTEWLLSARAKIDKEKLAEVIRFE